MFFVIRIVCFGFTLKVKTRLMIDESPKYTFPSFGSKIVLERNVIFTSGYPRPLGSRENFLIASMCLSAEKQFRTS